MTRVLGALAVATLLVGCASTPSLPDPPAVPVIVAEPLGPAVAIDRCSIDTERGALVLQGPDALLVRRAAGAALERLQPQRGEVLSVRGALLELDGATLRELEGDGAIPLPGAGVLPPPLAITAHPDGREIAVWSQRSAGPVLVVEVKSGALVRMLADHPAAVTSVAFAAQGRVITADRAGWVRVWGATGARPEAWVRPLGGGALTALAAGGRAIAACRGTQVWVWSVGGAPRANGGEAAGPLGRLDIEGECTALSLRDDRLAVASGRTVVLWDLSAGASVGSVSEAPGVTVCLDGPDALLCAGDDGRSAARWWPRGAWAPASDGARWTTAEADPVARLSADTFVGLYQRVRCELQRGDARVVVQLLEAHGVPDLHGWTEGSRQRLEAEPPLLDRVAETGPGACQ